MGTTEKKKQKKKKAKAKAKKDKAKDKQKKEVSKENVQGQHNTPDIDRRKAGDIAAGFSQREGGGRKIQPRSCSVCRCYCALSVPTKSRSLQLQILPLYRSMFEAAASTIT